MTVLWCDGCQCHHAAIRCWHCLGPVDELHPVRPVCDRCKLIVAAFTRHGLPSPGRLDAAEHWLPIPGFEGEYEASTFGRIKSLDRKITVNRTDGTQVFRRARGRILMERPDDGYPSVTIGGRTVRTHVLIAATFLGPRPDGEVVRHGNDRKADNWVANLRYGSPEDNRLDAKRNKVRQTHCPRGHVMTKATVHIRSDGVRICKTCIDGRAGQARSPLADENSA